MKWILLLFLIWHIEQFDDPVEMINRANELSKMNSVKKIEIKPTFAGTPTHLWVRYFIIWADVNKK